VSYEKQKLESSINQAKKWLLDSGIQDTNAGSPRYGSFRAWYDTEHKDYSFTYSEITGIAITAFMYLNKLEADPLLIERAKLAADWLIGTALDRENGGFRCRYYSQDNGSFPWLCSFDVSLCLNGLVNLYRCTGEEKYLETGQRVGDWLVNFMQKEDGAFYAKYHVDERRMIDSQERWSMQSGSYHAKNILGLLNLSSVTGNTIYEDSARKFCQWVLKLQEADGRFITNQKLGDTYMHPHCYSLEGLLYAGLALQEEIYLERAKKGVEWLLQAQLANGGISRIYDGSMFSSDESIDSSAQTIRLWLLLSKYADLSYLNDNLVKAIDRVQQFQCESQDPKTNGGYFYGCTGGLKVPHVSAHATMFVLQTLDLWRQKNEGSLNLDLRLLV
jgi:uncharacterized protein YyaL (SSP411 family)